MQKASASRGTVTPNGPVLNVPKDNGKLLLAFRSQTPRRGTCGPAAIAALTDNSVKNIIDLWQGKYRGYAHISELVSVLKNMGYEVNYRKINKASGFPEPKTQAAIAKVQWIKQDGTQYAGPEKILHAHYVLLKKAGEEWWVFDNAKGGWFAKKYAEAMIRGFGYVSGLIEISDHKLKNQKLLRN